jgi:hypothetical protein
VSVTVTLKDGSRLEPKFVDWGDDISF